MPAQFDHERLKVYQEALRSVAWVGLLIEELQAKLSARVAMTAGLIAHFSTAVHEVQAPYDEADPIPGREKD